MLKINASMKQIADELKNFLSQRIRVNHLILFGSYAYGSPRQDSDIDVVVVSDDFITMSVWDKIALLAGASVAVDSRIELVGVTSKDYSASQKGSLLSEIKSKGKILF